MHKIVEVKPLINYRMWIKFSDRIEGTVDLSDLVGKGVFSAWEDVKFFDSVFIDQESHTIYKYVAIVLCRKTYPVILILQL